MSGEPLGGELPERSAPLQRLTSSVTPYYYNAKARPLTIDGVLIESRIRVMMRRVSGVRPVAARPGVPSPLTMREISQPDRGNGATLAIYADERNPCLWAYREEPPEKPRSVVM